MNDSGDSVGPARGQYKLDLDQVIVVHDEIDLPFGEVQTRIGGGLAGHNGLKSLKKGLGGSDFRRVRVGVGRPDSTDPEVVADYVLSRFTEPASEVQGPDRARRERDRRRAARGGTVSDEQARGGPATRSRATARCSRIPHVPACDRRPR